MSEQRIEFEIEFELDGKTVSATAGETIWQVAKRVGTDIPHLCYADEPGYRADGNCRACMVEIEGEGASARRRERVRGARGGYGVDGERSSGIRERCV